MNAPPAVPAPCVFVVDDDRAFRDSLGALLAALGYAAELFPSAKAFLRGYRATQPGCLLLDLHMPEIDGLSLYERLLSEGKRLPVIFITGHASVAAAVAAMKTGAIEFLEKPFAPQRLQTLLIKGFQLDAEWRRREAEFAALEKRMTALNERDRETLGLVLEGQSNKAIAAKLLLTERAVEMRRAGLMRKLQVETLAELFDLALNYRVQSELRAARQV